MNNILMRILACAGLVVAVSAISVGVSVAEDAAPPPKVKLLMKNEVVSSVPNKEAYLLDIDWGIGSSTGRHFHSGYHNLAGIVHETKNVSGKPARSIAVLIIDKGKPPTEPVK
jgi:hypothetical protein